jgi:hypothetical protein
VEHRVSPNLHLAIQRQHIGVGENKVGWEAHQKGNLCFLRRGGDVFDLEIGRAIRPFDSQEAWCGREPFVEAVSPDDRAQPNPPGHLRF